MQGPRPFVGVVLYGLLYKTYSHAMNMGGAEMATPRVGVSHAGVGYVTKVEVSKAAG